MPLSKIERSLGRLRGLEIAMSTAFLDIPDEARQRMRDNLDVAITNAYENTSLTQSYRKGPHRAQREARWQPLQLPLLEVQLATRVELQSMLGVVSNPVRPNPPASIAEIALTLG